MVKREAKASGVNGCAGCPGCPLGRLVAEGKLSGKIDPERFQTALIRRKLAGGCAGSIPLAHEN